MNKCADLLSKPDRACPLIIMDLDNFKSVNDRFGHDVGDEVLKAIAREIKTAFRDTDYVGRFGGDEFMVLMDDCKDVDIITTRTAELLNRIQKLTFPEAGLSVQCSAGIALRHEKDTAHTLFKRADTALYQAKRGGSGSYRVIK